ncbi:MAG: hypothetical protein GF344_11060 [Chitinivibrionales bacterium]|nr:hypothetical protein [Chitinivibrionales bacterium]MBD3357342.1 hypothetical protein [Chitinivibrionales bacterium]
MKTGMAVIGMVVMLISIGVGEVRVRVEERGRAIQRDGFLPEWRPEKARTLGGDALTWDAVNTAEGLAGYVRYSRVGSCSLWTLKFFPNMGALQRNFTMTMDSSNGGWFYSVYEWEDDTGEMVSAEWIIPWDTISVDTAGEYEVGMYAASACGDTLESVVLSGNRNQSESGGGVFSAGLIFQILVAVVLLVFYFVLQARARKKYVRKKE